MIREHSIQSFNRINSQRSNPCSIMNSSIESYVCVPCSFSSIRPCAICSLCLHMYDIYSTSEGYKFITSYLYGWVIPKFLMRPQHIIEIPNKRTWHFPAIDVLKISPQISSSNMSSTCTDIRYSTHFSMHHHLNSKMLCGTSEQVYLQVLFEIDLKDQDKLYILIISSKNLQFT